MSDSHLCDSSPLKCFIWLSDIPLLVDIVNLVRVMYKLSDSVCLGVM